LQEYVLVYASAVERLDKILLIEKLKPDWQKGRFNLPGGKIEEGETPEEAAIRELKEETDLDALCDWDLIGDVHCFGVMLDDAVDGSKIHCVKVDVSYRQEVISKTDERVAWYSWDDVKNHARLIPNLQIIIPLMRMNVDSFTIIDNHQRIFKPEESIGQEHLMHVTVKYGNELPDVTFDLSNLN